MSTCISIHTILANSELKWETNAHLLLFNKFDRFWKIFWIILQLSTSYANDRLLLELVAKTGIPVMAVRLIKVKFKTNNNDITKHCLLDKHFIISIS